MVRQQEQIYTNKRKAHIGEQVAKHLEVVIRTLSPRVMTDEGYSDQIVELGWQGGVEPD